MENFPSLTEPGMKSFLHYSLKECKKVKDSYYNTVYNVSTFILFSLAISLIFIYRYNGGLTKEEVTKKNIKKKEYIFQKLQKLSIQRKNSNLITNLPVIDQEHPELNILNRKIF